MWKKPNELPELFPEYHWFRSKTVPVIVEGQAGWNMGYYHRGAGGYEQWRVVGFNGDYKVLSWFDLPMPKKFNTESFRQCKTGDES